MLRRGWLIAVLIGLSLSWPGKALSQDASPDALAAAKELMTVAKMADQARLMFPAIMQQLRPLITRGSPEVEKDFDLVMPEMMKALDTHMNAFLDGGAQIYARHFTVDEMRQVTAFMKTAAGQKFLEKQPQVMQESLAMGNRLGELIAKDAVARMTEELRKRGHKL